MRMQIEKRTLSPSEELEADFFQTGFCPEKKSRKLDEEFGARGTVELESRMTLQ